MSLEQQLNDVQSAAAHDKIVETLKAMDDAAQVRHLVAQDKIVETLKAIDGAAQVRHLREVMALSYTNEVGPHRASFSFKNAHSGGFTFSDVWEATDERSCPESDCLRKLREAGYKEVCTQYLGFSATQMRAYCQPNAQQLSVNPYLRQQQNACCTPTEIASVLKQIKEEESSSFDAALEAGFTVEEMELAGYACEDALEFARYDNSQLTPLAFVQKLQHTRRFCSADELNDMLRVFRDAPGEESHEERASAMCGYALQAGFTIEEMLRAEFTMVEIARSIIAARGDMIARGDIDAGSVLQPLKAAGMTCAQARKAGLRPRLCKQAGYTFREAKEAGYAYFEVHWDRGDETPNVEQNGWEE